MGPARAISSRNVLVKQEKELHLLVALARSLAEIDKKDNFASRAVALSHPVLV